MLRKITITAFVVMIVGLSAAYVISNRYTFFTQGVKSGQSSVDIVYRHDSWTGNSCIIAGHRNVIENLVQYADNYAMVDVNPGPFEEILKEAGIGKARKTFYSSPNMCYEAVHPD